MTTDYKLRCKMQEMLIGKVIDECRTLVKNVDENTDTACLESTHYAVQSGKPVVLTHDIIQAIGGINASAFAKIVGNKLIEAMRMITSDDPLEHLIQKLRESVEKASESEETSEGVMGASSEFNHPLN